MVRWRDIKTHGLGYFYAWPSAVPGAGAMEGVMSYSEMTLTILKFFEFLQESQGPLGKFHGQRAQYLGLVLISLGTLILIPAIFQNHGQMKRLAILDGKSSWSLSQVVAILVGGFGLFAFASSVFRWFF